MSEWQMKAVRRSDDGRTNIWHITPPCGHAPFSPPTTMLSCQRVECPRCGISAVAEYNEGVFTQTGGGT